MIQFLSCALLLGLSAPSNAAPPDWLKVQTSVSVSGEYQKDTPIKGMTIPIDVTITNMSRFRAVMKLTNIRFIVSGQVMAKFYKGAQWATNPIASRDRMPSFKNQVINLSPRDVEIMPGDVYKRKYFIPISWFVPNIGHYAVVQAGIRVTYRYLDFDVVTREMSTIKGVQRSN